MERFIPKNICCNACVDNNQDLIQSLGDGTKRSINFRSGLVTIHDKNGNLIFNKIFEINHPLIIHSSRYYFFHHTLTPDLNIARYLSRLKRRKQYPLKEIPCEEYYKIRPILLLGEE